VRERLPLRCEIVAIASEGDRRPDVLPRGREHAGFYTRDIDRRLEDGSIDIAVHSLKDLPAVTGSGLVIAACLERAAASDLLILHPRWRERGRPLQLRPGCPVGTGSLRREALLGCHAPEAVPAFLRGNVPTRVERCRDGSCGAVVLARAGVDRLELDLRGLTVLELDPVVWLPSPGQGVIAAVCRLEDAQVRELLAAVDDPHSRAAAGIERRLLAAFDAGCHSAFAALAVRDGGAWCVHVGRKEGGEWLVATCRGSEAELLSVGPADFVSWSPPGGSDPVLTEVVSR
jgi:hydroxymethylbilane synthase